MTEKNDPVNHPAHYKGANGLETIDVIENFGLGFRIGNAVKYLLRAGRKGAGDLISGWKTEIEDLRKAQWYIAREIAIKERAIESWQGFEKKFEPTNPRFTSRRKRKTKKAARR